eukprot:727321-Pyramimonas_sp.AAC.1
MNHTPVISTAVHRFHAVVQTFDMQSFAIPRVTFQWRLGRGACNVMRKQIPLRPAYGSTFNGAQGATLERCTVDARANPFAHGHLCVALGRVTRRRDLRAPSTSDRLSDEGDALLRNVAWKELLLPDPSGAPKRVLKRPASA